MRKRTQITTLLLAVAVGCDGGSDNGRVDLPDAAVADAAAADAALPDAAGMRTTFGGDRPVELMVPRAYREEQNWPLLVFLHGYSSSAERMLRYTEMAALVDEVGVLLVAPDGLKDTASLRFWNATDFCCDFSGRGVDDVAYLTGLVDEISEHYRVDPNRIFVWGHSNGGFMAHRLACERADTFAAIISFAGSTFFDEGRCSPSEPVSVLQIHGTNDEVIAFEGAVGDYPSAQETVARWARYNGCSATPELAGSLDLTPDVGGAETTRTSFAGCPTGIDVAFWSASGVRHFPNVTDDFRSLMWAWFEAHPKP